MALIDIGSLVRQLRLRYKMSRVERQLRHIELQSDRRRRMIELESAQVRIDKALEWIDRQLEVIDGQIMPPEKREAYTNALYHVRSVLSGSN